MSYSQEVSETGFKPRDSMNQEHKHFNTTSCCPLAANFFVVLDKPLL